MSRRSSNSGVPKQGSSRTALLVFTPLLLLGCAAGPPALPQPRPLVVSSGARLTADKDRLQEIYDWLTKELDNIQDDPSFLIESIPSDTVSYPWETLIIAADTARFQYSRTNPDTQTSYMVYAHLHLMKDMGRLEDWLPEAPDAEGYPLERAIMKRVADSWLLGRSAFDTQPSRLFDELIYASEAGYLDAFLFDARPTEFEEDREAWERENPGRMEAYRTWFRETFDRSAPGERTEG